MLLQFIPTEYRDEEIMTKALTRRKFKYHRDRIGVKDDPFLVERELVRFNKKNLVKIMHLQ